MPDDLNITYPKKKKHCIFIRWEVSLSGGGKVVLTEDFFWTQLPPKFSFSLSSFFKWPLSQRPQSYLMQYVLFVTEGKNDFWRWMGLYRVPAARLTDFHNQVGWGTWLDGTNWDKLGSWELLVTLGLNCVFHQENSAPDLFKVGAIFCQKVAACANL